MTNARFDPTSVTVDDKGVCVDVGPEGKDAAELRAEMMLVATGRAANIENIGLETTKIETDRGVIKVDGRMRTREPHVYAIGDIVGGCGLPTQRVTRASRPRTRSRATLTCTTWTTTAARDVLPARGRLDRADRAAGARAGIRHQGRQGPVPGNRQGADRRRVRRVRQGDRRHEDRRHARCPWSARTRPT